ncbi:MAG: glycerate kinase [Ornithinimicrobium sp.]
MTRATTRVLIAPDKFKGSLTAADVCAAVSRGLHRHGAVSVTSCPVADGGDGTIAAALAAGYAEVPVTVSGPTGMPVSTLYARRGDTAVVELADVSGLMRLPDERLEPLTASSRGTGEVMAAAIDAGCTQLVLGIGGSASTDGGAGLLSALGARLLDGEGADLADGGAALASLVRLEVDALTSRMQGVTLTVACDVDNSLTGPHGAAAVYGPQKGADSVDVEQLDVALGHWADVVTELTGEDVRDAPGAGAAGGVGYAGLALLSAELRPGIDLVFDLVGFEEHLDGVDLVITGEGSLDEQTLNGKAPAGVAAKARSRGIPVVAVCGRTTLSPQRLHEAGIEATYALCDLEPDLGRSMTHAAGLLEQLGEQIARRHLTTTPSSGGTQLPSQTRVI